MTDKTTDFGAFEAAISNLRIDLSKSDEAPDLWTVCSYSEPLFCFDAHSEEAAKELAINTLRSYGKYFFGIDDAKLTTRCSPVGEVIPVRRDKQVSTIHPILQKAA